MGQLKYILLFELFAASLQSSSHLYNFQDKRVAVWFDPYVSIMDTIRKTQYNETTLMPLVQVVSSRFSQIMIHITEKELMRHDWNTMAVLAVAQFNHNNAQHTHTSNSVLQVWISFHYIKPTEKVSNESTNVMREISNLCQAANSIYPGTIHSVTMHFGGGVKTSKEALVFQKLLKILKTSMKLPYYKLGVMHDYEECQNPSGSHSGFQKLVMPLSDVVFIDLVSDGGVARLAGYNTIQDSVKWLTEQFTGCKSNFDRLYQKNKNFEFGILTGWPDTSGDGRVSLESLVEFWKELSISAKEQNLTVIFDRAFDAPYKHPTFVETQGWWRLKESPSYTYPGEYEFEEKKAIKETANDSSQAWANKSVAFTKDHTVLSISSNYFRNGLIGLRESFEGVLTTFLKQFSKIMIGPFINDILQILPLISNLSKNTTATCKQMEIILLLGISNETMASPSMEELMSVKNAVHQANLDCPKTVTSLLLRVEETPDLENSSHGMSGFFEFVEATIPSNINIGFVLPLVTWCLKEQNVTLTIPFTNTYGNVTVMGISVQVNWFKLSANAERYLNQLRVLMSACNQRLFETFNATRQTVYIIDWSEITEFDENKPTLVKELAGLIIFWEGISHWAKEMNTTVVLGSLVDEFLTDSNITKPNGWWKFKNESGIKTGTENNILEDKMSTLRRVITSREPKKSKTRDLNILGALEITGIVASILVFLALVILLQIYAWRKLRRNQVLSNEEIYEFFNGKVKRDNEAGEDDNTFISLPYQREKCEIKKNNFEIDNELPIGSGEFGLVYKGKVILSTGGSTPAAVKTTNVPRRRLGLIGLLSEIKVLSYLGKHENIVELLGAYTEELQKGTIYVFLEYCHLGSLYNFLKLLRKTVNPAGEPCEEHMAAYMQSHYENINYDNDRLDPRLSSQFCKWAIDISKGMEFLASKKVVHGDVATRNILLSISGMAKVSDFGLSRRLYNYQIYVKKGVEPLPWKWMAPESLKYSNFTEKSDIWAFGVTLWEIYSLGETPYLGMAWTPDFADQLETGLRLSEPKFNEKSMFTLMLQCWHARPEARPDFLDILALLNLRIQ